MRVWRGAWAGIVSAGAIFADGAIAAVGPDTKAAGPDFEAAGPDFLRIILKREQNIDWLYVLVE